MDVFDWLMNESTVLDGVVIARFVFLAVVFNLFSLSVYWTRKTV